MNKLNVFFESRLKERLEKGFYRKLNISAGITDFSSNDYLGFAREEKLNFNCFLPDEKKISGSTGSRLLTGNSLYAEELEGFIASFHKAEAALVFNSGYDANLGLFSCVPQRNDTVIYDELIHASVRDGIRLSNASSFSFKHNDTEDLIKKIKVAKGKVFVAIESVYSMDGDLSPLKKIAEICSEYNAFLIVDEAHSTGIFGPNGEGRVVELGLGEKVFIRVHTFGKALGCHGAAVVGSSVLVDYLINFSRPFIYTTALPPGSLISIREAYNRLLLSKEKIQKAKELVIFFKNKINQKIHPYFISSESLIHCLICSGNEDAKEKSMILSKNGFDVRPVLSPTVAKGKERLRICFHSFNSKEEVLKLTDVINSFNFEK